MSVVTEWKPCILHEAINAAFSMTSADRTSNGGSLARGLTTSRDNVLILRHIPTVIAVLKYFGMCFLCVSHTSTASMIP